MKRKIKISAILPPIKEWKYFENFFLIPTIGTFSDNTYRVISENYMFTRYISILWLWFDISIQWEYGPVEKK